MATVVGEIQINTKLSTAGVTSGLKGMADSISGEMDRLGGKIGNVGSRAAIAFGTIAGLKKAFSWGGDAVRTFAEIDVGLRELQTITGELIDNDFSQITANYERFDSQLKSISDKYSVLVTDLIPATYEALSSGLKPDNLAGFVDQMVKLSTAGRAGLEETVVGVTQVINAYDELSFSTQDVTKVSDEMFGVVNFGVVRMEELAKHLYKVAPAAAALGVSLTDVNTSLAVLTRAGVPVRVAATSLQYVITELADSNKKAAKSFQALTGESFNDFIARGGSVQQAIEIIGDSADKTGKNMFQMFNTREAAKAANILNQQRDLYKEALDFVQNSAGATAVANAHIMMSTEKALDNIKQNISTTKAELGAGLAESFIAVGNVISTYTLPQVAKFLEAISKGAQGAAGSISVMVGDLAWIGTKINSVKGLGEALSGMSTAVLAIKAKSHIPLLGELDPGRLLRYRQATSEVKLLKTELDRFRDLGSRQSGDIEKLTAQMTSGATVAARNKASVAATNLRKDLAATEQQIAQTEQRIKGLTTANAGGIGAASKLSQVLGYAGVALDVGITAWSIWSARRAKAKALEEEHNRIIKSTADLLLDQSGKLDINASAIERWGKAWGQSSEGQKAMDVFMKHGVSDETLKSIESVKVRAEDTKKVLTDLQEKMSGPLLEAPDPGQFKALEGQIKDNKKLLDSYKSYLSGYSDSIKYDMKSLLIGKTWSSPLIAQLEELVGKGKKYTDWSDLYIDKQNLMVEVTKDGVTSTISLGQALEELTATKKAETDATQAETDATLKAAEAKAKVEELNKESIKTIAKLREQLLKIDEVATAALDPQIAYAKQLLEVAKIRKEMADPDNNKSAADSLDNVSNYVEAQARLFDLAVKSGAKSMDQARADFNKAVKDINIPESSKKALAKELENLGLDANSIAIVLGQKFGDSYLQGILEKLKTGEGTLGERIKAAVGEMEPNGNIKPYNIQEVAQDSFGAQAIGSALTPENFSKMGVETQLELLKLLGVEIDRLNRDPVMIKAAFEGSSANVVSDLLQIPDVALAVSTGTISITALLDGLDLGELESISRTLAFINAIPSEKFVTIKVQAQLDKLAPDLSWATPYGGNAYGGIITRQSLYVGAEGNRPEAVIPMTDTSRALHLLERTGLADLARRGGSSSGTTYNIYQAHNPQAVAAEIDWRERRRMVRAGLRR